MAATTRPQLVFVDGGFPELAQDLANYLQIGAEIAKDIEANKSEEETLAKLVKTSSALNAAPEKEFIPVYNLLIHLVVQSESPKKHLPQICQNLQKPLTSSPVNGTGLAMHVFQTIFNLLEPTDGVRYNVLMQILKFVKAHGMWDHIKATLHNIPQWLEVWGSDEDAERNLYMEIAEIAADAGEDEESYQYLLTACKTFEGEDDDDAIKSEDAQKISLRALRTALLSSTRYDFHTLRALPTVQALSDSHPVYSQLLDIFSEQDLEDYNEFNEEHPDWIEQQKLDHSKLQRKIRLLTFASLAASSPNREIEYGRIAKALQVPVEEVELWAIDVIRAGLVEGKLSQQKKVFLVHRTTYRVFGEKQWRELATRMSQAKDSLQKIREVVRNTQVEAAQQKDREMQELERKMQNTGFGDHNRRDRRQGQHRGERGDRPERNNNDD